MKLPTINYQTGTQSLGREDVSAPARLNAAKINIANSIGDMANTAAEIAQNFILSDSIINTESEMADFEAANKGKNFYAPEEIDAIGDEELSGIAQGRDLVPASEIYPQLYEKAYDAAIKRNRGMLVGGWAKTYDQRTELDKFNQVAGRKAQAISNMAKEHDAKVMTSIDEDVANGRWEQAHKRVGMLSNISDYDRKALHDEYNNQERTDYVSEIIRTVDVPKAYAERKRLATEKDNRFENESTQLREKQRLDAFLNGVDRTNESERAQQLDILKADIRDTIEVSKDDDLNAEKIRELTPLVEANRDELPEDLVRDFYRGVEANVISSRAASSSVIDRKNLSDELKQNAGTHDEEIIADYASNRMNALNEKSISDPIGYQKKYNLPVNDLVFDLSTPAATDATANSFMKRFSEAPIAARQQGVENQWMDKPEAEALAAQMNDSQEPAEFLQYAQMIDSIFGRASANFWDEARVKGGMDGRYAVLGNVVNRSSSNAKFTNAKKILEGRELRKQAIANDKEFLSMHLTSIESALGGAYDESASFRKGVVFNVMDAYYYIAKRDGNDSKDLFDEDILEEAIELSTGGLVNGNTSWFENEYSIEAPFSNAKDRTLNQIEWNTFTEDVQGDEFAFEGAFQHYTNDEVAKLIREDDVQFIPNGSGEFYLRIKGDEYINGYKGGRFIFRYNDMKLKREINPSWYDEAVYRAMTKSPVTPFPTK